MTRPVSYKDRRFPPQIIAHAVCLYFRLPRSLRLIEEMVLKRGIAVTMPFRFGLRWPVSRVPPDQTYTQNRCGLLR